VEDETWGCGTGAVACCLILQETAPLESTVTVRMLGGDLIVSRQDGEISFSGEVHESYRAVATLPADL
jgi:diaminopimelate epimerase